MTLDPLHHSHMRSGDGEHALPPGMTQDQLDYFAEETRRAAKKGAREGARRTARNSTIGFLILLAGVSFAIVDQRHYASTQAAAAQTTAAQQRDAIVQSGRVVSVSGCNRDFLDDTRFINLLQRLKDANNAAYNSQPPQFRDPAQHKAAQDFYGGEIKRATKALPDCRDAADVVTADPDASRPKIEPLYVHKP